MATINISTETLKKWGAITLIVTNLFATGVAVSYLRWRHNTKPAFALLDFDINDRLPQIKQRAARRQAEIAAAAAAAGAQADAAATPATPAPAPTPEKK